MRIVWTEPALVDLRSARAYIALDNPAAATNQIGQVWAAVSGLVHFPESGRRGRRAGTRELVVGRTPFIVAYRVKGEAIEVLRVLHGRRRWPSIF